MSTSEPTIDTKSVNKYTGMVLLSSMLVGGGIAYLITSIALLFPELWAEGFLPVWIRVGLGAIMLFCVGFAGIRYAEGIKPDQFTTSSTD